MEMLHNIQKDLIDQKLEIQNSGDKITEKVTKNINKILAENFAIWEDKHKNLQNKIVLQENKIKFLDKQARKRNIVFFGIEESDISYKDLEEKIIKFIKDYFKLDLNDKDIQEVKRVGNKGEKSRPIIVTFTTLNIKINLLNQKKLLNNTGYYIKEDFPKDILEKRKVLQKQALQEREKGNRVRLNYDRLIILKPSYKRTLSTLSTSPEPTTPLQRTSLLQNNKKNKTLKTSSFRSSISLPEDLPQKGILNYLENKKPNNSLLNHKTDNNIIKL